MANFTQLLPASGQQDVSRTSIISFTILDGAQAAQINTLSVTVNGISVISNGSFAGGYNGNIATGTGKHVVGIYPKAPDFLPRASQINIHLEVRDNINTLIQENYSFYTSGYSSAPAPGPSVPSTEPRSCDPSKPFFPPTDLGLRLAKDRGVGTEVQLEWVEAYPNDENNVIFYNIYASTRRNQVFDGYANFLAADTTATVGGLRPGDQYFFGVRVTEFNPNHATISGLVQAGLDLYRYPLTQVDGYVGDQSNFVPVPSTSGFPDFGILLVGDELIRYTSKQAIPSGFVVAANGRGFGGTYAEPHWPGSLVRLYGGKEDGNTITVQAVPSFQKPNPALTYVLPDGYGADGYRDGYDGYAFQDGYLMLRQQPFDDITTPGANNDASGEFPRFDYCGTWRVHPRNFMQGQCSRSYFGGAQVRIDDDGNRHLVKESSIRTHMLQREELLLESTGEPFVLVRRMWTGIRCPCVMLRREHQDARCPTCFVQGTLINTKRGFIPIEEIEVGEEVLSDNGEYKKVINVMERDYDGDVYKIETYTSNPIITTPEHPFLTMISEHNIIRSCGPKCDRVIKNGDGTHRDVSSRLLPSGNWWARVTGIDGKRVSLGTFGTKQDADLAIKNYYTMNILPLHRLDWKDAKDLNKGDWLENKWSDEINDIDQISIPNEFLKQTKLGSHRNGVKTFDVDEDFLWIVGIYLAEGSFGTRHINFSLHKDEVDYQNRILEYFKNLGFNGTIRKTSENGVNVEINSTSLSLWLPEFLGKKCYNKSIPNIFMNLPPHKLISLIQGIYDGDGNKNCNEIGQTSKMLALQIVEILHKLGKQPHLRHQQSNFLTKNGNKRKLCYVVNWEEETLVRNNRKNSWEFKEELLTRVKNVSKEYYSGKVYNLEVEDRHTYVVENIVVHNCFGTGFVQGYVQFFNPRRSDRRILIRVEPAADDVNIVDRGGLEPAYEPSAWTIAFPAVKDRDVLIRFNPDNTEEYRYEVLDVTRVRAFFTQTGAQKFRMKRFPVTSIIYQIPIIRDSSPMPGSINTSESSAPGVKLHSHQIVVPQGTNITGFKTATLVSEGHNHIIYNGKVQTVLGHTHTLPLNP
jgi:hypothetical protein